MVLDKIKSLLSSQLGIKEERIQLKSRILEDLGADSLDLVELLMTLEDEFHVSISDEEAIKLKTVEDIVKVIDANQSKQSKK
ncbi:MAG: acyl carrier protein [Firmicutes bacterium]|nr:acyl carrier protein [Bacillota bacterium]MDY5041615.1 acyl carrier protein [Eubacteriales bacterium]